MNWADYLLLADGLARHRFEASRRSAVSRAYYGAFNGCRRWLEANVTPIDDHRAHRQVWETFKLAERADEATRPAWRQVGVLGDALRGLRNRADYDDRVPDLALHAPSAVDTAGRILGLLAELELGRR